MPARTGVYIENLAAFRAALKQSIAGAPSELTKALKRPGLDVVSRLRPRVPVGRRPDDRHPGLLQRSYGVSVRGTTGSIVSRAPYGAGAEWGAHGKWKGFMRYGGPGRFAARQIDTDADLIVEEVAEGLQEIFEIHGWALPGVSGGL